MPPYYGLITVETEERFYPIFCNLGETLEKYIQV